MDLETLKYEVELAITAGDRADVEAARKAVLAARVDNIGRASRTRSQRVFAECKAARFTLQTLSDRCIAALNA